MNAEANTVKDRLYDTCSPISPSRADAESSIGQKKNKVSMYSAGWMHACLYQSTRGFLFTPPSRADRHASHILHLPRLRASRRKKLETVPEGGKNRRCCHQLLMTVRRAPGFGFLPRLHPVQPDSISPAGHSRRSWGKRGERAVCEIPTAGERVRTASCSCFCRPNELIVYPGSRQTRSAARCKRRSVGPDARQACVLPFAYSRPADWVHDFDACRRRMDVSHCRFSTCAWLCKSYTVLRLAETCRRLSLRLHRRVAVCRLGVVYIVHTSLVSNGG